MEVQYVPNMDSQNQLKDLLRHAPLHHEESTRSYAPHLPQRGHGMSKAQIGMAITALLLLFGIVGSIEMEDAKKIEAMRPQVMEVGK